MKPAAAAAAVLLSACAIEGRMAAANQTQPLVSPDSSAVLTVPVIPGPDGFGLWTVTIRSPAGETLFVDRDSEFLGGLNVYWLWDQSGRLWLYNSDDGLVHFYSDESGSWSHTVYGPPDEPCAPGLPAPPEDLFPDYVEFSPDGGTAPTIPD